MVNICIAVACYPIRVLQLFVTQGCDVKNFKITLIFLIKPFFCIAKTLGQKFRYIEKEKNFQGKTKSIFHHFSRALDPGTRIHFFEIFSKFKYFRNILSMLHEKQYSYNISEMQKNSFSDISRNLKFYFSNLAFVNLGIRTSALELDMELELILQTPLFAVP